MDMKFERACQAYRAREATLARAAELAELPLRDMILRLKEAGVELNYDERELNRDLQA